MTCQCIIRIALAKHYRLRYSPPSITKAMEVRLRDNDGPHTWESRTVTLIRTQLLLQLMASAGLLRICQIITPTKLPSLSAINCQMVFRATAVYGHLFLPSPALFDNAQQVLLLEEASLGDRENVFEQKRFLSFSFYFCFARRRNYVN